jgi:hypothetical protein
MGKYKTPAIYSYMQATKNDAKEYKESTCNAQHIM